jgi:hypothetical protein
MTDNQLCEMNIYCDESRHTSDPGDAFMVIGAISSQREQKREVVHRIHCLKKKFNTQGEFGWKRLSPNKKDFYWALIDLFKETDSLSFRCIVVDRNELDHDKHNMGDKELGFYKLYYQMLVHWLKPECAYRIYMDWQQNKTQGRFSDLKFFLQRKLSGRAKVACLEPVTSKNQPLIELTDLFIGAVGYAWNDRQSSQTKVDFCNELAKAVGFTRLKVATWRGVEKFNIFHFQGR